MTVKIKIISNAVTLIPAVGNENGDNQKSDNDSDIKIKEERGKIFCKCGIKLSI